MIFLSIFYILLFFFKKKAGILNKILFFLDKWKKLLYNYIGGNRNAV